MLKWMGIVFKMYANESEGEVFPPLAPYEDVWMLDLASLVPEHSGDMNLLVNPSHPERDEFWALIEGGRDQWESDWEGLTRTAARHYTYLGWDVRDAAQLAALADVRRRYGVSVLQDFKGPTGPVRRLREQRPIEAPPHTIWLGSEIPVMFDTIYVRRDPEGPLGRNVLYLDGHVEFIPKGVRFPATTEVDKILGLPPK